MRKNQEIQNELHELSPELAKLSCNPVYEAPEGYFEELPISLLKHLEDNSTKHIPEAYFEELPNKILEKINETSSVISIQKKYFYLKIAVAAVVIGILGIGIVYFLNNNKTAPPPAYVKNIGTNENYTSINISNLEEEINNLDEVDVVSYLEENGHDVNAALVASLDDDNADKENMITEIQVSEKINEIQIKN